MAWAPPTRKILSTPAIFAAAKIAGAMSGGLTMIISPHPAIFAGMAVISTVEG